MARPLVTLITGASRGIGHQLALDCARAGNPVIVNYRRDAAGAAALVAEIGAQGGQARAIQADVSVAEQVMELIDRAVRAFGTIGCVINNAGVGPVCDWSDMREDAFKEVLQTNLVSSFLVSQAAIPYMAGAGGRLIFMSSGAARNGGKISVAYAASKAGIEGMMHYFATYLRPLRITSNAIAPSLIETEMLGQISLSDLADLPLGRLGRVDEIWPAVRMIMETEYLTGQTIHLDAGCYMT